MVKPLHTGATPTEVRAWVAAHNPLLLAAVADVDRTLLDDMQRRTIEERIELGTRTASALRGLMRPERG